MRISASATIFFGLLITLALCAYASVYLPTGNFVVTQAPSPELAQIPKHVLALANAGIVLVFYGILGVLGLWLSRKAGFPAVWDSQVSVKQRFYTPALVGLAGGLVIIVGDLVLSQFNTIGHFAHPPFPTSLVAALSAGIGEELLFRLFFMSFWFLLLSFFFKKNQTMLFWFVAGLSALAFASAHFPAIFYLYGYRTITDMPMALVWEIVVLNSIIGLLCAWQFKKAGFLAAVGVHFWTDIVWHVIYGLLLLVI
ncbi:MAG: CPBP family glutamic-type intramembrane protease [Patescibacteria group bacterium]|nr:CPBP family glutamic-type intramembrane protease [Patescibacteria group bacterium]